MHYTENIVAIGYCINDYTHGKNIKNLIHCFALHICFAVNTVNTFYSTADIHTGDYTLGLCKNLILYRFNKLVTIFFCHKKVIFDFLIADWIEVLERTVLKLIFYGFDTESMSDRRKHLHIFK